MLLFAGNEERRHRLERAGSTTSLPRHSRPVWNWIWKSAISGLCGSAASTALMYFKARAGILPSFQPYENFQVALEHLIGRDIHPLVPWLLSYLNGSTVVGLAFGHLYRRLPGGTVMHTLGYPLDQPGGTGAAKGLVFGLCGWLVMNLLAFPLVGLGLFAAATGLGLWPALFSLAMLSTYSLVMGIVYGALEHRTARSIAASQVGQ